MNLDTAGSFQSRIDVGKRNVIGSDDPVPRAAQGTLTFLERALPFKELSLLAHADRRAADPVYTAHRWWARRPPAVMRGILLAAALREETQGEQYWRLFASNEQFLKGMSVYDPFVGGGSTLVEAARLGAITYGSDVDPLAVTIVRHELDPPSAELMVDASSVLLKYLEERVGHLFAPTEAEWTPLHYFTLHMVTCPHCKKANPLFRNLILARDLAKSGGVVRNSKLVVFCPFRPARS